MAATAVISRMEEETNKEETNKEDTETILRMESNNRTTPRIRDMVDKVGVTVRIKVVTAAVDKVKVTSTLMIKVVNFFPVGWG